MLGLLFMLTFVNCIIFMIVFDILLWYIIIVLYTNQGYFFVFTNT